MALSTQVGFVKAHDLLILQQTDDSAAHGQSAACSGEALTADTGNDIRVASSGTPGVVDRTITVPASTTEAAFFFESDAVGLSMWNSGVWKINLTIAVPITDIRCPSVHVCRVNSSGVSQGTVATGTTVKNFSALGFVQFLAFQENDEIADPTDRIYIVFVLENTDGGGAHDLVITPNQRIYTPIRTTIQVRRRGQRRRSNFKEMNATMQFQAIAPSVETVLDVAAPCAEMSLVTPTGIHIAPPYTLRTS